jgi:DDE family transposase
VGRGSPEAVFDAVQGNEARDQTLFFWQIKTFSPRSSPNLTACLPNPVRLFYFKAGVGKSFSEIPSVKSNIVFLAKMKLSLNIVRHKAGSVSFLPHALAMPKTAEPWSLTSLRKKLIKIGAKVVSHGRYVTFQMAEVAVPRQMFQEILSLIARLRAPPTPA